MKTRKWIISLLISVLIANGAVAQQVVATAGGTFEGDNVSLSWTLGEPVIATFESDDVILTQGFQQPYNFYLTQVLNIPAGWSGISGYIDPLNKEVEDIFISHVPDFIILASMTGFFYPEWGINTLNDWSWETGYQIKTQTGFGITMTGSKINPPEVILEMGWNLIPVLTPCGAGTDEIFSGMTNLNIVKEVAGTNVYWPDFGIATLASMDPGKAYWVSMNDAGSFTYPACAKSNYFYEPGKKPENTTPWNDPNYTAYSHTIVFPAYVLQKESVDIGAKIGVFTQEGYCAGIVEISDLTKNHALTAFANDETTIKKDGFDTGEPMQFKLYNPQSDLDLIMEMDFDERLPQQGIYTNHGLSAVKSVAVEIHSHKYTPDQFYTIYPNPSIGIFYLNTSNWPEIVLVEIQDNQGRVIKSLEIRSKFYSPNKKIDLTGYEPGVYFCTIKTSGGVQTKKLIKLE